MSIRRLMATAAAGLALATGAGQMSSLQAQNTSDDFKADNAFVSQVAAWNLLEVRLGQQAQSKAQTPRVKQWADKVTKDHIDMQQLWMATARKYGASFNARLGPEQQAQSTRLANLSGREFEVAYMDLMVQNRQTYLNAFNSQGRSARSAEVRELVERAIPMYTEHSRLAAQIRGELNTPAVAANDPNAPAQQPGAQPTTPWGNVKPEVKPAPGGKVPTQQQPNQTGQPGQPAPQPTAQSNPVNTTATASAEERADWKADAKFFHNALTANLMQQQLGQMAQTRSENAAVKRYGQMMAKDHAALQEWWIAAARRNGETVRPALGSDFRNKVDKLKKRSGKKFDKDYMTLMVKEHAGYLNYFQREGRAARSSDIRSVVNREIPTLWEHYNMAKRVGEQVGADTDPEPRSTSTSAR